jgi:Exostosin family
MKRFRAALRLLPLTWITLLLFLGSQQKQTRTNFRPHECTPSLYVLPLPPAFHSRLLERPLVSSYLSCEESYMASERYLHLEIASLASYCGATLESADFLFVPAYAGCALITGYSMTEFFAALESALASGPRWRDRRKNHLLVLSADPGRGLLPSSSALQELTVLTPSSEPRFGFLPRDVAIPPFSHVRTDDEQPKTILAYFAGTVRTASPDYSEGVRAFLLDKFSAEAGFVLSEEVSPSARAYSRLVASSDFCLCPSGEVEWTQRFYDSVHFGCLPVVFPSQHPEKELVYPFASQIDYDSFVVSIPREDLGRLPAFLRAFSNERKESMRSAMRLWAPKLKYRLSTLNAFQALQSLWLDPAGDGTAAREALLRSLLAELRSKMENRTGLG